MVLPKRLDYGFNGYQVPAIPRGSRSARGRRGSFRKKVEDEQMCAFELLATVAGKLLQEKESSSDSSNASIGRSERAIIKDTVKQERQDIATFFNVGPHEQRSADETVLLSELGLQVHNQIYPSKDSSHAQNDVGAGLVSDVDNAFHSEKVGCAKRTTVNNRNEVGKFLEEGDSPGYGQLCEVKVVDRRGRQIEAKPQKIGNKINGAVRDTCSSEDPMELDTKPPALVNSDSSIDVPNCMDNHISRGSFSGFPDDDKVVSRDDDENSSGCTEPSTIDMKAFRPSPRIGDRRIRKLLASKYWKVAPKLNDGERSKTDTKLIFHNRKTFYTRQRSQRNSSFKRRKLYGQSLVLTSEGGISNEGVSKSPEKGVTGDTASAGSRASSSVSGQKSSFKSRDSHGREVKLSIKSFRVPELFIEIPETATVGSLKRTVMEAVTAILGGGLCVGMILKGNKVRDDNKTLAQTGISHGDKLDNLGFTLEPNPAHASLTMHPEDPSFLVPCDTHQSLTRYPTTPTSDPGISDTSLYPPKNNLGNFAESDHDSVLSPTDTSADKTTLDSRALVAIPSMSMDALAVVPLQRKSRRSELVQRRIRRPFSVSEVEALVQAVEKLGTGRWRDVKLCAFDNAKHRTYVDLKDKWKTLVHTARISPQQRRGEPVPQELLDRVLSARAYWSKQQAKQQVKNETCLLL